jgi:hypothetical protein
VEEELQEHQGLVVQELLHQAIEVQMVELGDQEQLVDQEL